MFAGHVGAALAIGRIEPRASLAALVAAALWLDAVLWLFVLLGWEAVAIPPDFATRHQAQFVFPYSHGLVAAVAWSALAAALVLAMNRGTMRIALWIAAAVFSHWLLDALVHRPELPLLGASSPMAGLAWWDRLPLALAVEAAIVVVGLWLYLPGSGLPRGRAVALAALVLLVLAFTVVGMTVAPPPPSATAMAASSLATLVVLAALVAWIAKRPRSA